MMKKYLMVIFASLMLCTVSFVLTDSAWAQGTDPTKLVKDSTIQVPDSLSVANQAKTLGNIPVKTTEITTSGSSTSGNVEKPSFVGSSNLSSEYYGADSCGGGNIFQQLACRAGLIGSGLKTVGYMIAGFGLIVFSFMAIFGKVKWPVFATIMFCCFLLSATIFVVNMMTKEGDASWIGGVKAGSISASSTAQPKGNIDANEVSQQNS
jgi:hypothetical protein